MLRPSRSCQCPRLTRSVKVSRSPHAPRAEILGAATVAERDTSATMKTSMTRGWTGAFDKLEAMLGSRSVS